MGTHSEKAAAISGPIIRANALGVLTADPTGNSGTMRYAVTTASQGVPLPVAVGDPQKKSTIGSRFLWVLAAGCNVQLSHGEGSAPTLVFNQLSAFGVGHVAAGPTLVNGTAREYVVPTSATHLAFIGDAAGFIEFYVSDGQGRP
jgi:hypothetical protein